MTAPRPTILEIGRTPRLAWADPDRSTWVPTGGSLLHGDSAVEHRAVRRTGAIVGQLLRIRRGAFDVVAVPALEPEYGYGSKIKRRLRVFGARLAATRLGPWLVRALVLGRSQPAIVIVDNSDKPRISYETCRLLPTFTCYFKRELVPSITFDANEDAIHRRVHHLPLMVPNVDPAFSPRPKHVDVFFAGQTRSKLRREGIVEIRALESLGISVDIPNETLTYPEYVDRMSAAWIVWSPRGFGWDCYRHYEACYAGSVPLINESGVRTTHGIDARPPLPALPTDAG